VAVGAAQQQSLAIRWLERLERRLYRDAAAVACITRSFVRVLTARGVDEAKLHFVPNGILPEFWASDHREQARRELGVASGEVLLAYAGTTGMAHGLATVLEAMARLQTSAPQVRLLVVGDGAELDALRAATAARSLANVHFS